LDALGHCLTIYSLHISVKEKSGSACYASNKHKQKKSGEFFVFFQKMGEFSPKNMQLVTKYSKYEIQNI
jgi:hypothetical protein